MRQDPQRFRYLWPAALMFFLLCTGCGKSPHPDENLRQSPAEKLFLRAEKAYSQGLPQEAEHDYIQFLKDYPDHNHTPTALFKLGSLYSARGKGTEARNLLGTLIRSFPQSALFEDALLARCSSWYTEKHPSETLSCIRESEARILRPDLRIRLAFLKADTLAAAGSSREAMEILIHTLETAPESLHAALLEKILGLARELDAESLAALLPGKKYPEPAATLTLALGVSLVESGRYRAAEETLQDFIKTFPLHSRAPMARDLLTAIASKEETDPLAIGCLFPLSGRLAPFGQQALRGIEMAMALYTEQENALPLRLLIEDTRSDEASTEKALQSLNEKKVIAIIGPLGASPESIALAADFNIPLIALTQQEGITGTGPEVFRNFMTPAMQVRGLVSHVMTRQNLFRFAILYPQDAYGENFRDLFWDAVENAGGRITGIESYPPRSTDFSEPIRKLTGLYYPLPADLLPPLPENMEKPASEEKPSPVIQFDALFIPDSAERAGMVLPQLAYHDVEGVQLLGTNLWHSPKLLEMAGSHARGALVPTGFFPESSLPQVQNFVRRFQEFYGENPGYLEAVTFDSLMLLFKALEQKPYSRSDVRNILLHQPPHEGVTGIISFSENREAMTPPFLLEIKGGQFREIQP